MRHSMRTRRSVPRDAALSLCSGPLLVAHPFLLSLSSLLWCLCSPPLTLVPIFCGSWSWPHR